MLRRIEVVTILSVVWAIAGLRRAAELVSVADTNSWK